MRGIAFRGNGLCQKHVEGLEVSMDDRRLEPMKVLHAACHIERHPVLLPQGEVDVRDMQQVEQRAAIAELEHRVQGAGLLADAQQPDQVRMARLCHDHELSHKVGAALAFLLQTAGDNALDCDLLAFQCALEDLRLGARADLGAERQPGALDAQLPGKGAQATLKACDSMIAMGMKMDGAALQEAAAAHVKAIENGWSSTPGGCSSTCQGH